MYPSLPRPNTPETKILMEFSNDRHYGRITQEQLEEACDFWTVEYAMGALQYQPTAVRPFELNRWIELSAKQRDMADEDVRKRMKDLASGFSEYNSKISNGNRSALTQLINVARTLGKYKNSKLTMVEERISDFTRRGVKSWCGSL